MWQVSSSSLLPCSIKVIIDRGADWIAIITRLIFHEFLVVTMICRWSLVQSSLLLFTLGWTTSASFSSSLHSPGTWNPFPCCLSCVSSRTPRSGLVIHPPSYLTSLINSIAPISDLCSFSNWFPDDRTIYGSLCIRSWGCQISGTGILDHPGEAEQKPVLWIGHSMSYSIIKYYRYWHRS